MRRPVCLLLLTYDRAIGVAVPKWAASTATTWSLVDVRGLL